MTLALVQESLPLTQDEHGVVRVRNSRISLDAIVHYYKEGGSAEDIAESFPTLELADIYEIIAFYLHRKNEVEEYLRQQQHLEEEVYQEYLARPGVKEFRERVKARINWMKENGPTANG